MKAIHLDTINNRNCT